MKKIKFLILLLSIFTLVSISYNTSSVFASDDTVDMDSNMGGGSGTESDPFLISSLTEFSYFVDVINSSLGDSYYTDSSDTKSSLPIRYLYYKLTTDLDIEEYTSENSFTGIGTSDYPFYGNFDGDNHTVSGFDVSGDLDTISVGFFSFVKVYTYTAIENITVDVDFDVEISEEYTAYDINGAVGGIIGILNTNGSATPAFPQITNCVSNGSIIAQADYIGGIIGFCSCDASGYTYYVGSDPIITSCINNCDIEVLKSSNYPYVAGISGAGAFSIQNCINNGDIVFEASSGFLAGISAGFVYNGAYCLNYGNLTYDGAFGIRMAGIFSTCRQLAVTSYTGNDSYDYQYGVVRGCVNYGNLESTSMTGVSSYSAVGGICAYSYYTIFINCVNYGEIPDFSNLYYSDNFSGAIIGSSFTYSENTTDYEYDLINCYSSDECGLTSLAGNDSTLTDNVISFSDMQDEDTFTDFDFSSIWSITDEYLIPTAHLYELTYVATETIYDNSTFLSAIPLTYCPGDNYFREFSNSTLKGMYYDSSFTNEVSKLDLLTEDTTIYTDWNVSAYTITLYLSTDQGSASVTVTCDVKNTVIDLTDEAFNDLEYLNFDLSDIIGFSTEKNGEGTVYSLSDTISFDYSDYEYQTLYIVTSQTSSSTSTSVAKKVGSIIGIILLLMVLLLVAWFLLFFYKRRKDEEDINNEKDINLDNTNKNKKSFKEEALETIKDMKKSFLNVLSKIKNWFKKIFSKKNNENK